jgi:LPXTG-site transpeptidase (sortase) family protein
MTETTTPSIKSAEEPKNDKPMNDNKTLPSQTINSGKKQHDNIQTNGKVIKESRESIMPSRIQIPKLNVDAKIETVGLLDNGQMGVPASFETVGWYENGPKPGERGNAVFAGHVDSKKGPAVFFYLKKLKEGDEVIVFDKKGKSLTFMVKDVKNYPTELSPVDEIFDYSYQSHLNLITCTGVYNRKTGNHSERLVVYTILKR